MEDRLLNIHEWLGTPTSEPTLCGVSLQNTVGIHHYKQRLGNGFYVYINDDASHLVTSDFLHDLRNIAQAQIKPTKKNDTQSKVKDNE
jgi:hypothetical protein